jgi:hypothetical protein
VQTAGGGFALAGVSQCASEDHEGDGGSCTAGIVDGESERLGKSKSLRGESHWLSNERKTLAAVTPGKKIQ